MAKHENDGALPAEQKKPETEVDKLAKSVDTLLKVIENDKANRTAEHEEMMSAVDNVNKRMDELQNQVEEVSDKGRLSEWEKKTNRNENKKKIVNLQSYKGKIVVGWTEMNTNDVTRDSDTKRLKEDLTTTLIFEDGTKLTVDYALWQAKRMPVPMVLEGKKEDLENDRVIYVLSSKDGKKYEVDVRFVN